MARCRAHVDCWPANEMGVVYIAACAQYKIGVVMPTCTCGSTLEYRVYERFAHYEDEGISHRPTYSLSALSWRVITR